MPSPLAKRGFQVTATDISTTAVSKARQLAKAKGLDIEFKQDDILDSKLNKTFDFIFDRGCFHIFHPQQRKDYVKIISNLIKPGGYLFLKTFSHLETMEEGPYRFSPEQIKFIFSPRFKICSIEETVYQGTMNPLPRALFCILQKS